MAAGNRALLDLGAKAIYEFRAHPRRKPWAEADPENRRNYLRRMRQIIEVLASAGYEITKAGKQR